MPTSRRLAPHRLLALAPCVLLAASAGASDWPQFLGPQRDGSSPETGLARSWPKDGPKMLWRAALGPGYGGAAVKDHKVYVFDRDAGKQDILRCLDLQTGKELWTVAFDAPGNLDHDGSRAVPVLDDRYIFLLGPLGNFHCLDQKTHAELWKSDFAKDYEGKLLRWGTPNHPLLYKDWVILAPQGKDAGLVACEKASGKVVWKSLCLPSMVPQTWCGSYVSPQLARICAQDQILFVAAQDQDKDNKQVSPGQVVGFSAQDGTLLWSYEGFQCVLPMASPVPLPDDRVFVTAAYGAGSVMLQILRKPEGGFEVRELFKTKEAASQIHQPLLYKDHLYIVSNGKERREGLACLSLGGVLRWHTTNSSAASGAQPGLPNFDNGNALLADGMIYILDGAAGDLRLIEPDWHGYKELACVKALLSGKEIWAPMALSEGKLLIRDQTQMKCLDVKNPGP